jgi:hypothetical protein
VQVRLSEGTVRLSELKSEPTCWFAYGFQPFSAKIPIFNPPIHQNKFQKVFIGQYKFNTLKHIQVLELKHQHNKIHQIIITSSTFNNNTKSLHQFINLDTQSTNSTTTYSKSITTTNEHKFMHNSTPQHQFLSNLLKNTKHQQLCN